MGADGGVLTGAGGAEAGGLSVISVAITIGISDCCVSSLTVNFEGSGLSC